MVDAAGERRVGDKNKLTRVKSVAPGKHVSCWRMEGERYSPKYAISNERGRSIEIAEGGGVVYDRFLHHRRN